MLTPLWQSARPLQRTVTVPAEPVRFDCMGRSFLYEPNDMRLYTGPQSAVEAALEEDVVAARPQFEIGPATPRMLVFILTRACNLRCRYCFASPADADPSGVMSLPTAKQALRMLDPSRRFTLGFFGGEALLAFGRLREIVEEAEMLAAQHGGKADFSLTTNGLLLDATVADYLARKNFSLIVSLDGPAELHDPLRPAADGRGSHARVLEALPHIGRHPELARRTTLRGTFAGGREAEPDRPAGLVRRLVFLNAQARRHGLGNVSVEPADLSEGCAGGVEPVHPTEALRHEYEEAARWFVTETRAAEKPKFHHLSVRLSRLAQRRPAISECGAGGGYLTVTPEGTLHACHRLGESRVGETASGVDTALQAPWRDNRYYARKRCSTCWLRNACGGGCRLNSRHRCGDIREPDPLGCWLTDICSRTAAWVLAELREERSA